MGSVTDSRSPSPLAGLLTKLGSATGIRRLAVASLVMNIGIILSGGLVRLTDSGLGCPTWPQCSAGSYTPHQALGIHGVIEFTNRTFTFILMFIALITWIAALAYRRADGSPDRRLRWLTFGMGLGIPFQGVIGGITVHTDLNPYVVALHMLDSLVLVALSVWLVRLTWPVSPRQVASRVKGVAGIAFAASWVVVCLGTIVTGSGPHAGDLEAHRTGLNAVTISHLHAAAVYLLVAATLAVIVLLRGHRPAVILLIIEVSQGIVGFVQYYNGLPIGVVELHLLGAACTIAGAANLFLSITTRTVADSPAGGARVVDSKPAQPVI